METLEEILQSVGKTMGIKDLTLGGLLQVAAIVLVGWLVIRVLMKTVDRLLARIAAELRGGNIDADPCGYSEQDNACTYCEFASACNFPDGDENDRMELIQPVTPQEFWDHVNKTISEEGPT